MAGRTASDVSERALLAPAQDAAPLVPFQSPVAQPLTSRRYPLPALPADAFRKRPWPGSFAATRTLAAALRRDVALEIDRGAAFLLVPVFLAFGAIVYFALPFEPGAAPAVAGAMVVGLILALLPSRGALHLILAAAMVCLLGFLAAKAETWRAGTKMLGGEISTIVTGKVAAIDHLANGRTRLTLDLTATARPELRYAPDRIRASAPKVPAGLTVGAEVTGLVRLMPPSGPVRPQSYDFSFESYFDGIGASGFFLRAPQLTSAVAQQPTVAEKKVSENNDLAAGLHMLQPNLSLPARISAWIQNGRNAIADRIRESVGGPEGEIAAALAVGVRAGIPEAVNESLRRTGLYHNISISGLHMALVAGTIMGGLRAGFALFPGFASRRPVKKYAAVAALAAIAAYLFISGGEVAAQRSFIMLAVMLTALLFDRAALTMRNLAISAIVVIAISPHEVMGPSFQMSFAATAALVGAYAWWSDRQQVRSSAPLAAGRSTSRLAFRKILAIAAGLVVTSIVAGLATAVFGAYHFQRVSPLSLAANLVAMPIVSVLVMPFAVMGAVAMPFGLDAPFFYVMGKGLSAMIAVADWFSARSPLDAVGLVPVQAVLLTTVALIFATMTTTTRLRLAALPFAVLGLLALASAKTPDVFVSEDGRLVALRNGEGELAVNRARPNQFTIDSWKRALGAETVVPPAQPANSPKRHSDEPAVSGRAGTNAAAVETVTLAATADRDPTDSNMQNADGLASSGGSDTNAAAAETSMPAATASGNPTNPIMRNADEPASSGPPAENAAEIAPQSPVGRVPDVRFDCDPALCAIRHPSGHIVAHTADASAARSACNYAALIVIDDAIAELSCGNPAVAIVTKRELARHGSAAIYFAAPGSKPEVRHAVAEPYRPWHAQRRFSRAARGMPPYQRKTKPPTTEPAQ
jgi:ComEC/Rec2-related protein